MFTSGSYTPEKREGRCGCSGPPQSSVSDRSVELVPRTEQVTRMQVLREPVVDIRTSECPDILARDVHGFEADGHVIVEVVAHVQVERLELVDVRRVTETAAIRLFEERIAPVVSQTCRQSELPEDDRRVRGVGEAEQRELVDARISGIVE